MSQSVSDWTYLERKDFIRRCQMLGQPCPIYYAEGPDMVSKPLTKPQVEPENSGMFFPDDILGVLHEFTRPCFKYFREFNAYTKIRGYSPLLRMRLDSDDPERVRDLTTSAGTWMRRNTFGTPAKPTPNTWLGLEEISR